MFDVRLTRGFVDDLRLIPKTDQVAALDAIEQHLVHEPDRETRNRKRLRPNRLAEWELRVGTFRVFYDVDTADRIVKVVTLGRKEGNRLFVRGRVFEL